MHAGPRTLPFLLYAAEAELGGVARQARYLDRVRSMILAALPESAATHVHVAAIDAGRLLLHVDNAGWATRIRYADPLIRRTLAQQMRLHIETIVTRVRPALASPKPARVPRHISASNREHLRRVATYIDHPALAEALSRLASQEPEAARR